MRLSVFGLCFLMMTSCFAGRQIQQEPIQDKLTRIYVGGYGGYGAINGMYQNDGQYAQYRFALGWDIVHWKCSTFGIEGGLQSGNTMRAWADSSIIAASGGLYPQVILKPFLDLLAEVRWTFLKKGCLILKGGIVYRQLQFLDRTSAKDSLNNVTGELQAGIGYLFTRHARIVAYYQGIYSSSNLSISLAKNNDLIKNHIPTQQTGLLGIEYTF